ncbi:MAG: hypothetical protein ABI413_11445 [Ktedonobacteraceae bacterium]
MSTLGPEPEKRQIESESSPNVALEPRKQRSDTGARITPRDKNAIRWIAQQYAIRLDHLQILLARLTPPGTVQPKESGKLTLRRTQDIVDRWVVLELVCVKRYLTGEPPWIWVSSPGLKFLANTPGFRFYVPKAANLAHLHSCNIVRLYLEKKRADDPSTVWQSEREIRAGLEPRPEGGGPHVADAEVETARGVNAVEVEISMKTYARLDKILRVLAVNTRYQTIWYYAPPKIKIALEKALAALPESFMRKFVVYDLEELERLL